MDVGVIVPQGWQGEYDGWDPAEAWERTAAVARQAEDLGFESIWVYDHFHTVPEPTDEITFESFSTLSALAASTSRVRIGHVVICTAFRNPAVTAKTMSTMDVISGGRMELGIGAGWKRDEWEAYGFGFPGARERLRTLGDHLEVIEAMFAPGRASVATESITVDDAINEPRGLQRPRIPIMVGGNGPKVTWRLAARFADELNLDGKRPEEVADDLPVIRSRCEEIDRDPDSLRLSVHVFASHMAEAGPRRVERIQRYAEVGVDRIQTLLHASVEGDEALEALAADCRAAGVSLSAG